MDSYWYDDWYDYGYMDLSVDGLLGGLLGGFGSLFDGLFYDDYYYSDYSYDYGYGWDDDISVDSSNDLDDYSLLDSIFGLVDGLTSYDDTLSVDGSSGLLGLLDGVESVLGGLFSDDYYYGGYDYDYGYGYDYDYGYSSNDVISVDSSDDLDDYFQLDAILGLLGGSDATLSVDGSSNLVGFLDLVESVLGGLLSGGYSYDGYDYEYDDLFAGADGDISIDGLSDALSGISGLDSILALLGDSGLAGTDGETIDTNSLLSSIFGMLGDSGLALSTDGETLDTGSLLSSIFGMLGDSGTTLSVDGGDLDLSSILGLLGGSGTTDTTSALSSILGLLGGTGTTDTSSALSSILGLLGGSGTTISTDSSATTTDTSSALSSILGLLGGSGTTISTDSSATTTDTSSALSSILGLLGGSGTTLSVDGTTTNSNSALSSILGLLGGSGTTFSVDGLSGIGNALSGLASLYGGITNLSNGDATWDDLAFLDDLTNVLPGADGTGTDSSSLLSSILGLLGGSGTTLSVGSGTTDTSSALSSILGLLGGSGTTISTDSSATTTDTSSTLSSILALLGGSGTTISTDSSATTTTDTSSALSSILGLLGGTGTTLSVDGTTTNSNSALSSILGLLGGSGTTFSVDGLSGIGNALSGLASLYGGITNLSNGDATWDDLAFLDDLTNVLPGADGTGTDSSSLLSSILGLLGGTGTTISTDSSATTTTDTTSALSSILGLLGGSGTTLSVDGDTSSVDLSALQDLLDKLTDGKAKLKIEITLTTDEGSSSFQYDGLLSNFIPTVTMDAASLVSSNAVPAPEMTVCSSNVDAEYPVLEATQTALILSWGEEKAAAEQGYWVEISRGNAFDDAVRVFTTGTSFDVDGSDGAFSCRAALRNGSFETDAVAWTAENTVPRQIVSNGNGLADVFFASPVNGEVWRTNFKAGNDLTGETVGIAGKNRIRDTFSGSASDANILYLTDSANGDALFMDDIYSEFGAGARLSLIREIRSGAGNDVIDMTSGRYSSAALAGMTVRGGSGDDVLWGSDGGNMLFGDDGNDRISGGSGSDIIAGGSGNDVLNGGGGSDLFTFGENWGDDVVSQINGGSIALWFAEDESAITAEELDGNVIFRSATSSVTVENSALAGLEVHFGSDQSVCFTGLTAAGAFLGSTAVSVFETQTARAHGILASL